MAYYGGAWYHWVTASTAGTASTVMMDSTSTGNVWQHWTAGTSTATTLVINPVWAGWAKAVEETHEQKAARLQREADQRAEWARRNAELKAEQDAAVAKAEVLLTEHLNAAQRDEYQRLKSFLVEAPSGRTYRIRKGWSGNVELLNDEDEAIMRFCIHPSVSCPDQDNMLAQKLLLETDEDAFTRIANKTQLTPRRQPVAA